MYIINFIIAKIPLPDSIDTYIATINWVTLYQQTGTRNTFTRQDLHITKIPNKRRKSKSICCKTKDAVQKPKVQNKRCPNKNTPFLQGLKASGPSK